MNGKEFLYFFRLHSDSDLPFDIFAASFFLVTRYEEYLDFKPDKYGRFPAPASHLHSEMDFLEIPVIDLWARRWSKIFLKKFQNTCFQTK